MNWLQEHISGFINFGFAMAVIAYVSCSLRSRYRKRQHFWGTASKALEDHSAALRAFVDSPDSPDNLKFALLSFSEAVSRKEGYSLIVEALTTAAEDDPVVGARDLKADLAALEEFHPELAKAFGRAIVTGTVYSIARWQDATEVGMIHAGVELSDEDRKITVVSKVADGQAWPLHPNGATA
ncbi:hypothetical protein AZC_0861 [Azorhizobium caulinodans ORS 571]|uniref:Uncharacterized protein n=1 Tax=Azorhizobium caulinodans (strain ATCC 43989 / DSM 5975 / JCM 20966 / LMG 6465 / NBRC 14845 / NCIMB 13405 / ORS 571) TaxID=438753 RepID=A8HTQ5_AZOC5|nr:hypothetical protein [Azorhizobium caulinodans]BAF86859.1 hypothetical protein AZC_0861 [Azorhizobium caulinodans ORS 571]